MTELLSLNCWVVGDHLASVFDVELPGSAKVSVLRDVIKAKAGKTFGSIDAKDIQIWAVAIPLTNEMDVVVKSQEAMEVDSLGGWKRLGEVTQIRSKDDLHVVVKKPEATPGHQVHNRPSQLITLDESIITRPNLVELLYERVNTTRLVQVRGTPASSGKSTLLHLLHHHICKAEPEALVYRIDGWTKNDEIPYREQLRLYVANFPVTTKKTYLLLDEGQDTYSDHFLWNGFFKILPSLQDYRVAIFCSYGSPNNRASSYLHGAPTWLGGPQRIQLWPTKDTNLGLLLTRQELDQMIDQRHPRLFIHTAIRNLLFRWTAGYVGFVKYFLESIERKNGESQRQRVEYNLDKFLDDHPEGQSSSELAKQGSGRGLPVPEELRHDTEMTKLFHQMVRDGSVVANILDIPPKLDEIHKKGWTYSMVQGNGICFVLVAPLHYSYISWLLRAPEERLDQTTILQFTIEVVKLFQPSRIFSPVRRAGPLPNTAERPPEVQYQDEFYRVSLALAHGGVRISPKFATGSTALKAGRIDFLIAGPKWGVEITQDGDRLQEHSDRFGAAGAYGHLIAMGYMTDYVLLDCRTSIPRKAHPGIPSLYHAVFDKNNATVTVYDNTLHEIHQSALLE